MERSVKAQNADLLMRLAAVLSGGGPLAGETEIWELEALGLNAEEAMRAVLLARMGLSDDTPWGHEVYRRWLPQMLSEADPLLVEEDPYVRAVGEAAGGRGSKRLKMDAMAPYEVFARDDFRMDRSGRVLPQLGFFARQVRFPAMYEDGVRWMSCEPNEIMTLRPLAKKARGKVVMLGLGLGYYAFHALLNPRVSGVVCVEREADTIALFREELLEHFPRKECLRLVCGDAYDYVRDALPEEHADTVLADLWRDAGDGAGAYLKLKGMETPGPVWQYWIEPTIRYYLEETHAGS